MDTIWNASFESTKGFIPTGEFTKSGNEIFRPVVRRAVILKNDFYGSQIRFTVSKIKGKYKFNDPRHKDSGLKGSPSLSALEWVAAVENMLGFEKAVQVLASIV